MGMRKPTSQIYCENEMRHRLQSRPSLKMISLPPFPWGPYCVDTGKCISPSSSQRSVVECLRWPMAEVQWESRVPSVAGCGGIYNLVAGMMKEMDKRGSRIHKAEWVECCRRSPRMRLEVTKRGCMKKDVQGADATATGLYYSLLKH